MIPSLNEQVEKKTILKKCKLKIDKRLISSRATQRHEVKQTLKQYNIYDI